MLSLVCGEMRLLVYKASTQREALGFIFIITFLSFTWGNELTGLIYYQISLIIFLFVVLFIKYEFKIEDSTLTYQISFFKLPIYKKVISHNHIKRIKYKRVGWATKCAIIQVEKGFNIRIANFTPNNVFLNLTKFSEKQGIPISKTKDYLILEK